MSGYWSIIVPEAATNLITNPSFETGTTGWAAGGGNSIAQSSDYSKFGAYSLKVTYQDTQQMMNFTLSSATALSTTTQYHASCYVYVPSNWDGGDIYIKTSGMTGVSETVNYRYTDGTSAMGIWIHLELNFTTAADATGGIGVYTDSAPTATRYVYVDGFHLEEGDHATTYVDGDQNGCKWSGTPHASTSIRDAQSRAGGREYNLDDYSFYITDLSGHGMPSIINHAHEYSLQPGGEYQGYSIQPRSFALIGEVIGSSRTNLHAERQELINAIKPDLVKGAQPFLLRYTGADSEQPVEIEAVYSGGLEGGQLVGHSERIVMRLTAYDPFFYEVGQQGHVFITKEDISNTNYIIGNIDNSWSNMDQGVNAYVDCMAYDPVNKLLYVGGWFTTAGSGATTVNYVAYWDGSSWNAMGTGMNDYVADLLVDASGDVYAVGEFTSAGGNTAYYIAKWNGSTWSAVGAGLNNYGYALALGTDGTVYIGGAFTDVNGGGGGTYNKIIAWDGSSYSALSTGMNGTVWSISVAQDGNIYAGGNYTTAGGTTTNGVAKWDGSSWIALGTGVAGGSAYVLTTELDYEGNLYIGGSFTSAGGNSANYIAKWNGVYWSALGSGVTNVVDNISYSPNGVLYVGGGFTMAGGLVTADHIATWDGDSWNMLNVDLPGSPTAANFALPKSGDVYIGFDTSGTAVASYNNTSVNNGGTASSYPVIEIKRTGGTEATLEWIRNETTNVPLYFNYSLQDGETLTIDTRPGLRTITSSLGGAPIFRALRRGSNLTDFKFIPGNNDISVKIEESGSPTITMKMYWRKQHWTFDGTA